MSAVIAHFLFYLKVEGLCECGHFPLSVHLQVEGTRNLIHLYLKDEEDTIKLQRDIDRLDSWARKKGYEISTCQMQYDAVDKKTDQEDPCFIYIRGN